MSTAFAFSCSVCTYTITVNNSAYTRGPGQGLEGVGWGGGGFQATLGLTKDTFHVGFLLSDLSEIPQELQQLCDACTALTAAASQPPLSPPSWTPLAIG